MLSYMDAKLTSDLYKPSEQHGTVETGTLHLIPSYGEKMHRTTIKLVFLINVASRSRSCNYVFVSK